MKKNERIEYLVGYLNKCCDEYYNGSNPSLSDAQYDTLFDELIILENETGYILQNSPTQRAGYEVMSELTKVEHNVPLLSLAKTKDPADIIEMAKVSDGYLSLKMDGLTVELKYVDGALFEASTRGDGAVGEVITHNAKTFKNIPKNISDGTTITVTGEAYIGIKEFEFINSEIDNDEEKYSTPRNLAAGSVRQLDSRICAQRGVKFMPFNVLEGMENVNEKTNRLLKLKEYGFDILPTLPVTKDDTEKTVTEKIFSLKSVAEKNALPIDGIVFSYNDVAFSKSLGKTSHHFRDGIAFKFGDPQFETVLKNIDWNISRTGQLTPIAEFEPVEIDNTKVEKASLHNMTFIENLKLKTGDKILVSKRNMIIPHVEKNITGNMRDNYVLDYPTACPVCGTPTKVVTTETQDKSVKVLYCNNQECPGRHIKKFTHFVSKSALNIDGLSESTLSKFIKCGFIKTLSDIFNISRYREEIALLDGFGKKSADNICSAVEKARNTTLANLLVALNIGLIGKNAAILISDSFDGDPDKFISAIKENYDFSLIEGFGEISNKQIYDWFNNKQNLNEYNEVIKNLNIKLPEKHTTDSNGQFFEKIVVITGTFEKYSRDELTEILRSLGAKPTTSVSKKTDYVLCGENAGSKLQKAKELGVKIIFEKDLTI